MAGQAISKLPSPMEFPDVIHPVTAKDYPALWEAFGLDGNRRNGAEIRYERLSAQIAAWTGHEHAVDRKGYPFSRSEWQDNLYRSINHLNNELKLGMDRQLIDVLTLCYTALQESPRYGGDPLIESWKGENTAVHSLHTLLQAFRIYQKTLEKKPDLSNNLDFFRSFQMTCLIMAVHDLGEMFGEAGSLAQVANTGNWDVKDKAAYERMVFNYGVRLAVSTVIDKNGTEQSFFDKIDKIKSGTNVQNQGLNKTDQQMAQEVYPLLKENIPLSARAKKLFDFLESGWEWIEDPSHSRNSFLGYLAATCERIQGTRHINRMMATSKSPHIPESGKAEMIMTHSLAPGYRLIVNSDYTEGHLGPMCHFIDKNSSFEKILAQEAVEWAYETLICFYKDGPDAFVRDPSLRELKLHNDGSAFDPGEVKQRLSEITTAKAIAEIESRQISLAREFQKVVIPIGMIAVTKKDVVSLYRKAIETGYVPGMVNIEAGKTRGEILIRDLPESLTGLASNTGRQPYSRKIRQELNTLTRSLK